MGSGRGDCRLPRAIRRSARRGVSARLHDQQRAQVGSRDHEPAVRAGHGAAVPELCGRAPGRAYAAALQRVLPQQLRGDQPHPAAADIRFRLRRVRPLAGAVPRAGGGHPVVHPPGRGARAGVAGAGLLHDGVPEAAQQRAGAGVALRHAGNAVRDHVDARLLCQLPARSRRRRDHRRLLAARRAVPHRAADVAQRFVPDADFF